MSPRALQEYFGVPRFPRVSGDEPCHIAVQELDLLFSPRERG